MTVDVGGEAGMSGRPAADAFDLPSFLAERDRRRMAKRPAADAIWHNEPLAGASPDVRIDQTASAPGGTG